MTGVKINQLSWSFGEQEIFKELSLMILPNAFTGIIGPNGSGKTTLLKQISASLKPKRNTVFIGEEDVLSFTARNLAQKIALVSQNNNIEYDFSVEDIILMGRNPYIGRFEQESTEDIYIARKAMEMTGVLSLKDRLVTQLSGGERQRVIIARALAQQSEIILLDEPISNLDIKHQVEILHMTKALVKEQGITVICVLHDLNLAAYFCDDLILLDHGRIFRPGTPVEVLEPETIQKVCGLGVTVLQNPVTGSPCIIPDYQ